MEKRNSTQLKHHGIIGMKWGVRRFQNKDGSLTAAGRRRMDKELGTPKKESKELTAKKSIKDMSDEELRARIARMNLEKQYVELKTKSDPPKSQKGKDFAKRVLERSGENIAVQLTTYMMGAGVNKVAKDVFKVKNSTVTLKSTDGKPLIGDDGREKVERVFKDIVDPRKGQKDK
jgi:hypothetical protein